MNIYLELMAILGLTIVNAGFATPEVEWRNVAALGLIFIGQVAQVSLSKIYHHQKLRLMVILGLTIVNVVFAMPEVEWRKVAALGLIFNGLVAQVIMSRIYHH